MISSARDGHPAGMSNDDLRGYADPQATGLPDQVERDPAALSSAEDLDEDRLRVDPLEEGMDPPEHWSEADKFGMTAEEMRQGESHEQRLAEEQPDVQPEPDDRDALVDEGPTRRTEPGDLSQSEPPADEVGGVTEAIRTPPPAS